MAVPLWLWFYVGVRYGYRYAKSRGSARPPKFPLRATVEGVRLESLQPGLVASKMKNIPGIMKTMLEGGRVSAIGGYRVGNRYIIDEGNHRMAAALQLSKETGNPRYVTQLLEQGRWDPYPPSSLTTYNITR